MNTLFGFVILAGVIQSISGDTCTGCAGTYTLDKSAASTKAAQCTALRKYAECLMGSKGTGCSTSDSTSINTQFSATGDITKDAATANCVLDSICTTCQVNFQKKIQARSASTRDTQKCVEDFEYVNCVDTKPSSQTACDGTTSQFRMFNVALSVARLDCVYAGTSAVKSSVVIMAAALFVSYLKF
ncbi:uncharacterized protein LOC121380497 [Gigantopelta aegis]|uniref:uncharacterized protein LOC121380497 n=1 Tax=Gigantopelta aegis TaxID=1735272 RepID=UPI001B8893B6|nr:uncharacterized protein LOC121380497 [Gigantopelta aegis]